MATFILIPGAGGVAWYWHRVTSLLEAAGHEVVAVDLPGDDATAGITSYVELVVQAAAGRKGFILVAQSLGGFIAPLVCERVPVGRLVFVNAMIPNPGERAGDWWENTGAASARAEAARRNGYSEDFDLHTYFLHDVPDKVVAASAAHVREQADTIFSERCRFNVWPNIPIHVIVGADDRFFPLAFQQRIAKERLGAKVKVDALPGGHLLALSRPRELADQLMAYLSDDNAPPSSTGNKAP
jgi:pimeloyl-ACP methyl ester carboxylesterase